MNSPFFRFCEEERYKQRLVALLPEVRLRSTIPTVMTKKLLTSVRGLVHFYFIAKCFFSAKKFYLEACRSDRQRLFAVSQNVKRFSMRVSGGAKYYCQVSV